MRRHIGRHPATCKDCRNGKVITREHFYDFWLERFTPEEIEEMGKSIWA